MSATEAARTDPHALLDGLTGLVESPRRHDDRLWFAHRGAGEVVAVDLDGHREVVAPGPAGLGWSLAWLPDGRLLVTGDGLTSRTSAASASARALSGGTHGGQESW